MFKEHRNYAMGSRRYHWPRKLVIGFTIFIIVVLLGMVGVRQFYYANLSAVSNDSTPREFIIEEGDLTPDIGEALHQEGLIRNSEVFQWYVKAKNAGDKILAGTYRLQESMSTPQIVEVITQGQVATELFTIYPGQRLDQIRQSMINSGFSPESVDRALNPSLYGDHPAMVDRPPGASLEGYLYPESFQRNKLTSPEEIIEQSLDQMSLRLTPQLRNAYSEQGLSVYEAITIASIVEQEANDSNDRKQIAQVFLKRYNAGMQLGSDVTAFYGAVVDGAPESVRYDSPYNTRIYDGLPPTPISNVSDDSLEAVANPANTDWLFFVAGDDGKTYFSKTLAEHERLTELHCTDLCGN